MPRPLTTKRSFTLIEVISILDWGYWPVWPLGSEFSNDLIENLSEEINSGKIFLARSCLRRGKSSSSLFSRKLLAEWQTLGQSQSLAASKANLDSLDFTLLLHYSLFLVLKHPRDAELSKFSKEFHFLYQKFDSDPLHAENKCVQRIKNQIMWLSFFQ